MIHKYSLRGKQSFTETDVYKNLEGIPLRRPWTFVKITVCEVEGVLTEQASY
jgi:hypothetical protein